MKRFLATSALAGAALMMATAFGAESGGAPRLAWHFVGAASLEGDTNAVLLRRALTAPATVQVLERVRERLADAPQRLAAERIKDPNADLAGWLREGMTELVRRESYGDYRLGAGSAPAFAVGIRVGASAAADWERGWAEVARALGAGSPEPVETTGAKVRLARWPEGSLSTAYAALDDWVGMAIGAEPLQHLAALREHATAQRRDAGSEWFECRGDLAALLRDESLPAFRLTVVGEGQRLRTQARFDFPADLNLDLTPWKLPMNTIRDPLVGFLAVRGFGRHLARCPLWQQLAPGPAPNQYCAWSLGLISMLSYFAFPMPDAANVLREVTPRLQKLADASMPYLAPGHFEYQAETNRTVLRDVIMTVPFLEARPEAEPGFLVGGVSLPLIATGEPPPPALLEQLTGTPDLVAYHWELTQPRLDHWWNVNLFYSMVRTYPPPSPESAVNRWLRDPELTKCLGNAVTEIRLTGPRTLALNRRSSVGLTGFELVQLARWIDGEDFPCWTERQPVLRRLRDAR